MKSKQLKILLNKALESSARRHSDVTLLNDEMLAYAVGGQNPGDDCCPMLQFCGNYCCSNCSVKVIID